MGNVLYRVYCTPTSYQLFSIDEMGEGDRKEEKGLKEKTISRFSGGWKR
jgi:hypothetical protein